MELWLRERIFSFANVILRVPPLFVIDELLRIGFGLPEDNIALDASEYGYKVIESDDGAVESMVTAAGNSVFSGNQTLSSPYAIYTYKMSLVITLRFLASCIACVAAFCTFMLWTKHLIIVYLYLISVATVFVSYWSNASTISTIIAYMESKEDGSSVLADVLSFRFFNLMVDGPGVLLIQNYILQTILAHLFCYIHLAPRHRILQRILGASFIVPSYLGVYPLFMGLMSQSPTLAAVVPIGVCTFVLWHNAQKIIRTLRRGYDLGRTFITNYGLSALAETQWTRLHVPSVLRTFWLIRVAEQIIQIMSTEYGGEDFTYYSMLKALMVNGCDTLTAVLGMTSIISLICHYIGSFFHWILLIDDEDEKSIGAVSAMLFYILALQTGLTSLDKENRLLRLCRNLCLLFTAVLLFVHNIVNPLMMSLSASHNPALHRHLRALGVCLFLIVFPIWLLNYLWAHYTMSTWLIAVTVFSVEVVVKVCVSLAIYSLFLYDAYRKNFWDELDDWVYIIRSFGNTVEFTFGIVLFFNGFWILVFEAGGAIRAFLMCVHAYFNLWCEAKAGWSVFMKRRHAVNKINSLPEATEQQIQELADVCAICYQEMETARITRCNHYFHGVCLRKWLYVQDRCPLCHEIMYKTNNQSEAANVDGNGEEQRGDNDQSNNQDVREEDENPAIQSSPSRNGSSTRAPEEQEVEGR